MYSCSVCDSLLALRVAGCVSACSWGLLLSVTQSRASAGTFHCSGSAFIKSCAIARQEYLAVRPVGTCCRHPAPWRNSLFWVNRAGCKHEGRACFRRPREKCVQRHETYTQTSKHTHSCIRTLETHKHTNRSLRLNKAGASERRYVLHTVVAKLSKQHRQQLQISAGEPRWLQQRHIPRAEKLVHHV